MSFDMYMYDTLTLPINPERMHTHRPEEINAKAKKQPKTVQINGNDGVMG